MVDILQSPTRSPKRSFAEISSNPRRTSPSQSKSLSRHKKVKIDHTSEVPNGGPIQSDAEASASAAAAAAAVTSSTAPTTGERESSSDRSAAKWFKNANENVDGPSKKPEKREDDSPFYMSHQNKYQPSNHLRSVNVKSFGRLEGDETLNDELREVIDDLTVENKKLKSLLRTRHPWASPASNDPDRVVEVRTHGLPPEKKRELEILLKNFTTGINGDTASQPTNSNSTPAAKSAPSTANGASSDLKPLPAYPSNTDSGYASISNSALNSTSYSGVPNDTESKEKKDSDINNYLHDIPDCLFPQNTLSVSESTKMRLVVQRLEQLFTGNLALPGEHSLTLQQQKIARSAAKADRMEDEKLNRKSQPEGSREAHVFPPESKINLDAMDQGNGQRFGGLSTYDTSSSGTPKSKGDVPGTPDQRPTRPLDLDIHRAQVAGDNIRYIQHLGLSSPQVETGPPNKEQPWMYLNLLVSLAQLHTLNVTPAFVRKAVKAMSTKFELSRDGHRIRWKGDISKSGPEPPQPSPNPAVQRSSDEAGDDGGRRRNVPTGPSAASTIHEGTSTSFTGDKTPLDSTTTSSNRAFGKPSTLSKSSSFDYKPLVYKRQRVPLQAEKSYLDSSSSGDGSSPDSTGVAHPLSRSNLRQGGDSPEGFITFFNNPYYLVDLSGDKTPNTSKSHIHPRPQEVLGVHGKRVHADDVLRDASACYFVRLNEGVQPEKPVECPDIDFPISPIVSAGEDETQPMELPASGIGGVIPEDNFALDVKVERVMIDVSNLQVTGARKSSRYAYRVVQCTTLQLQPSRLPPPSYVFFTSSSSSGEQDYLDGGSTSDSPEEDESPAPAGFLWKWSSSSNDQQAREEYSEDSSLGVLQAARARAENAGDGPTQSPNLTPSPPDATMAGSLAATVGATHSAASAADPDTTNEGEPSERDMDVE